jgi:hypothetical protein
MFGCLIEYEVSRLEALYVTKIELLTFVSMNRGRNLLTVVNMLPRWRYTHLNPFSDNSLYRLRERLVFPLPSIPMKQTDKLGLSFFPNIYLP